MKSFLTRGFSRSDASKEVLELDVSLEIRNQSENVQSGDADYDVMNYGIETSSLIPQLGFNREQSATFEKQMDTNLPKVIQALLAY